MEAKDTYGRSTYVAGESLSATYQRVADDERQLDREILVYGTLRRDQSNHRLMHGLEFVKEVEVKGFEMYVMSQRSFRSIPFVTPTDDDESTIVAEMYRMEDRAGGHYSEILCGLDMLEDHPNWYRRVKVVPVGESTEMWMYIFDEPMAEQYKDGCMRVETGDWVNPTK